MEGDIFEMAKKVYVSELFDSCNTDIDCENCGGKMECAADPYEWPHDQYAYLLTSKKDYKFQLWNAAECNERRTYLTPAQRKNYIMNGAIEITV